MNLGMLEIHYILQLTVQKLFKNFGQGCQKQKGSWIIFTCQDFQMPASILIDLGILQKKVLLIYFNKTFNSRVKSI